MIHEVLPPPIVDLVVDAQQLALAGSIESANRLRQAAYHSLVDDDYSDAKLCQVMNLFVNAQDMESQAKELASL